MVSLSMEEQRLEADISLFINMLMAAVAIVLMCFVRKR